MINWVSLAFNTLWILGLSGLLATLSVVSFVSQTRGKRFRQVFNQPGYEISLNASLILLCLGLAGGARTSWERTIWLVLAGFWGIQIGLGLRRLKTTPEFSDKGSGH